MKGQHYPNKNISSNHIKANIWLTYFTLIIGVSNLNLFCLRNQIHNQLWWPKFPFFYFMRWLAVSFFFWFNSLERIDVMHFWWDVLHDMSTSHLSNEKIIFHKKWKFRFFNLVWAKGDGRGKGALYHKTFLKSYPQAPSPFKILNKSILKSFLADSRDLEKPEVKFSQYCWNHLPLKFYYYIFDYVGFL